MPRRQRPCACSSISSRRTTGSGRSFSTWPAVDGLLCGSGLDAQISATANALAILGDHDVRRDGSGFSDDLSLPPGTQVELDATLHDPAPPPSCAGTSEKAIDLVLEGRRRFARPLGPDDVHLRASFGPLDVHVEAPRYEGRERTCVGRGDSTHHHYEYLCTCGGYPDETSGQLHVWDRIAYAIHTEGPPDTGRSAVEAVWSVPCGARLRYPPDTRIVNVTDDRFELTPAQERAREQAYAMEQALNAGLDAIVDRIGR